MKPIARNNGWIFWAGLAIWLTGWDGTALKRPDLLETASHACKRLVSTHGGRCFVAGMIAAGGIHLLEGIEVAAYDQGVVDATPKRRRHTPLMGEVNAAATTGRPIR